MREILAHRWQYIGIERRIDTFRSFVVDRNTAVATSLIAEVRREKP